MKLITVDLNLCSLLFVGVVPMINPNHFCFMYFVPVGVLCFFRRVWQYSPVLWLTNVDVNLCVLVCGCSPFINIVIAFCCVYWFVMCWRVCGMRLFSGCFGLPLMFSIFCVVFCGCGPYEVPCGACKKVFVGESCFSSCWCLMFYISWVFCIVGVVTMNLDDVRRMHLVPVGRCQFIVI